MIGRRARIATELVVVAALLAAGFWYGRFASINALTHPDYHYLIPAASVAVGKGFHAPVQVDGTPLGEFIAARAPAVAWADATAMQVGPPDQFHQSARYLIYVVGYWWRIVGISWAGMADVAGGLHAMAVLGCYFLLRLFVPVPFAVVGAFWMCASTLQLAVVPHVRDYSKGAFIFCALPLVVMLALHDLRKRRLFAVAAATGVVIGLGLGFKMDVAIMAPLAIVAIVLFRGRRPWTELVLKAEAVAVLVAALFIAAGPLLYQLSSNGSNAMHVILLGYTESFDTTLGIESSGYSFLPFYSDAYVVRMVQAHSGLSQWLNFPSAESDAAGQALWFDLMRNFPADVFARALAAANAVMNLCFTNRDPSFLTQALPAQPAFIAVYSWMNHLDGLGGLVAVLFVLVAAWSSVRRGALAALLLLALASYPSLQFESRHYFHAQIVPLVAIVVLLWALVLAVRGQWPRRAGSWIRPLAATGALMAVFTVVPLAALRAYQSSHLEQVFTRYLAMRAQLQTEVTSEDGGVSFVRWAQAPIGSGAPDALRAAHYVVEFQDDGSAVPLHVGVRYDAPSPGHDYSRILSVAPVRGPNRIGFSVFSVAGQSEFAGLELGAEAMRRLSGVYRVAEAGPAGLPLDVRLPADWTERTLYQRLTLEGNDPRAVPQPHLVCAGSAGCQHMLGYLERLTSEPLVISGDAVSMVHAAIASVSDRISVDGAVENESSYLVQLKDHQVAGRGAFVAAGYLTSGGVAVGLLKDRVWYQQAIIKTPGAFAIVVPIAEGGTYTPLITNAMSPGQRVNHLTITKAGFLEPR